MIQSAILVGVCHERFDLIMPFLFDMTFPVLTPMSWTFSFGA